MGSKWFKYDIFHIHQSLQRDDYTRHIWCKIFLLYAKIKVVGHPARLSSLISSIAICYLNIRIALQAASAYPKLWQISVNETSKQSGQRSFILLSQHYDCYTCLVLLFNILARSNTSL